SRYIRIEDLRRIKRLKDKILLVVKISENTKIDYKKRGKGDEIEITAKGESVGLFHIEDE
ncbi:hypothetical protein H311_05275, partial [Anncaliia algerae PRA109]